MTWSEVLLRMKNLRNHSFTSVCNGLATVRMVSRRLVRRTKRRVLVTSARLRRKIVAGMGWLKVRSLTMGRWIWQKLPLGWLVVILTPIGITAFLTSSTEPPYRPFVLLAGVGITLALGTIVAAIGAAFSIQEKRASKPKDSADADDKGKNSGKITADLKRLVFIGAAGMVVLITLFIGGYGWWIYYVDGSQPSPRTTIQQPRLEAPGSPDRFNWTVPNPMRQLLQRQPGGS